MRNGEIVSDPLDVDRGGFGSSQSEHPLVLFARYISAGTTSNTPLYPVLSDDVAGTSECPFPEGPFGIIQTQNPRERNLQQRGGIGLYLWKSHQNSETWMTDPTTLASRNPNILEHINA